MNQMKKITQCSGGHFYDSEKFSSCPYCTPGAGNSAGKTAPVNNMANDDIGRQGGGATVPVDTSYTQPLNAGSIGGSTVPLTENVQNPTVRERANVQTTPSDEGKTVGMFAVKGVASGKEPVVGWLVCTNGEQKGEDFRLKAGKNFIGRDSSMDICLKDKSVSRNKHCIVVFEPKQKIFIVQSGDARELSYLNESIILEPKALKMGDIITVGSSSLMFVPFCGETFSWE